MHWSIIHVSNILVFHPNRVIVINGKGNGSEEVAAIAEQIEHGQRTSAANIILRQKSKDPHAVYIEVCSTENTEKLLQYLSNAGFTEGPQSSEVIFLNEGQVIEVQFRGEIINDDEKELHFTYHSHMATAKKQLFVKPSSRMCGHMKDDMLRGYAKFSWTIKWSMTAEPAEIHELPLSIPVQIIFVELQSIRKPAGHRL